MHKKFVCLLVMVVMLGATDLILAQEFPSMHITSPLHPFEQERNFWHDGTLTLQSSVAEWNFNEIPVRLRGRGSSTWRWGEAKRPLRLRFTENRYMFGSANPHRDWVTFANHFDLSLMRNHLALYMAQPLNGMDFIPSSQFFHLYINGAYVGLYQLTDERDIQRIPLAANQNPTLSEYWLERDWHMDTTYLVEDVDFFRGGAPPYDMRFPGGGFRNGHMEYARDFIINVNNVISAGNWEEINRVIDVPSFIDFYIVQEFFKDSDGYRSSVFMTIRGQGSNRRLYMGPIWDFDLSAGNTRWQGEPGGYSPYGDFIGQRFDWYRGLLRVPEFRNALAERWGEIGRNSALNTVAQIRYLQTHYSNEFRRNFEVHSRGMFGNTWWNRPDAFLQIHDWDGHVDYLYDWMSRRFVWMDRIITAQWTDVSRPDCEYCYDSGDCCEHCNPCQCPTLCPDCDALVCVCPMTVTFDLKGGVFTTSPSAFTTTPYAFTVTSGSALHNLPVNVIRYHDGYYRIFGWHTEPGGQGTRWDSSDPVTQNITLYANWKRRPANFLVGDVNGDGRVTSADSTILARFRAGHFDDLDEPPFCIIAADVNGDGRVNMDDLILLARWLVGHNVRYLIAW